MGEVIQITKSNSNLKSPSDSLGLIVAFWGVSNEICIVICIQIYVSKNNNVLSFLLHIYVCMHNSREITGICIVSWIRLQVYMYVERGPAIVNSQQSSRSSRDLALMYTL